LRLLHEEYFVANSNGYGYTKFVELYNAWAERQQVVMRQVHQAGDKCFIDYSGKKPTIVTRQPPRGPALATPHASHRAGRQTLATPHASHRAGRR
jgi:transposase